MPLFKKKGEKEDEKMTTGIKKLIRRHSFINQFQTRCSRTITNPGIQVQRRTSEHFDFSGLSDTFKITTKEDKRKKSKKAQLQQEAQTFNNKKLKREQSYQDSKWADLISKSVLEDYQDCFNVFDQNKDGAITADELFDTLDKLGFEPQREDMHKMIDDTDDNADGKMDMDEFIVMLLDVKKHSSRKNPEQTFYEAFQLFDRDGNGSISRDELKQVLENIGEDLSSKDIDEMVKEADNDGDDNIAN